MMGTQYVSVRNTHNETLLRRKIGILPADFNIEIKGGELANEGSIVISTQHPCMSVLKDKTLEVARKRSAGQTEILLKAEGIPPAFVSLQIYPNLGAAPVEMTLPFPAKGCSSLMQMDALWIKILLCMICWVREPFYLVKMAIRHVFHWNYIYVPKVGYRHGMNGVIPRGNTPSNSIYTA